MKKFLIRAKRATYAGDGKKKLLEDGSKELIYQEGQLIYRDRYFNYNPFFGEELIFNNEQVVWGMNYQGRIISDKPSSKEIYSFLKKALLKVDERLPFRGPKKFEENNFIYINEVKGNFDYFIGKEKIIYNDKIIYVLDYHGLSFK